MVTGTPKQVSSVDHQTAIDVLELADTQWLLHLKLAIECVLAEREKNAGKVSGKISELN